MVNREAEAARLVRLRESWGWVGPWGEPMPQAWLATALGVDVGTVSRWERSARPIPARVLPWLDALEQADGARLRTAQKYLQHTRWHDRRDVIGFWREVLAWGELTPPGPSWQEARAD